MDYIKQFEIELDKDVYYAGETLSGCVLVKNTENVKVQGLWTILLCSNILYVQILLLAFIIAIFVEGTFFSGKPTNRLYASVVRMRFFIIAILTKSLFSQG